MTEVTLDEVRELQPLVVAHLDALEAGLRSVTGQLPVGPAGRPDVLAVDAEGGLAVIELKAVEAGTDALVQLCRYYDWLSQNVALVARPFPEFRPDQGVRSMLVAPGFSPEAVVLAVGAGANVQEFGRFQNAGADEVLLGPEWAAHDDQPSVWRPRRPGAADWQQAEGDGSTGVDHKKTGDQRSEENGAFSDRLNKRRFESALTFWHDIFRNRCR